MPIQQSGNVTPGHIAAWVANGVIGDGGPSPNGEQVLSYINASFNDTNDQPLVIPSTINVFCITRIIITNASTPLTTAQGGFYPQASKGGTPIVSAAQVYSTLTTSANLLNATLASYGSGTRFSASNVPDWAVYLSLTTGNGNAATADVYVVGIDLTVRS